MTDDSICKPFKGHPPLIDEFCVGLIGCVVNIGWAAIGTVTIPSIKNLFRCSMNIVHTDLEMCSKRINIFLLPKCKVRVVAIPAITAVDRPTCISAPLELCLGRPYQVLFWGRWNDSAQVRVFLNQLLMHSKEVWETSGHCHTCRRGTAPMWERFCRGHLCWTFLLEISSSHWHTRVLRNV